MHVTGQADCSFSSFNNDWLPGPAHEIIRCAIMHEDITDNGANVMMRDATGKQPVLNDTVQCDVRWYGVI